MIRLARGPKPGVLEERGEEWAREFVGHVGPLAQMAPSTRYRYRHAEIKEAVKRDSSEKCIYCESKITHVYPGEIDHLLPASKRRDLSVAWENLGYVCAECNREKRDYYEPALPLLDPYEDEPGEHLAFYGPMVLWRSGSERGEVTVRELKLHRRPGLLERKKERIEALQVLIDRISAMAPGPLRTAVETALDDELLDEREYAATARAFVAGARADSSAS